MNARGIVHIRVTAEGCGRHAVSLRTANLRLAPAEQTLRLEPGQPQTLTWEGKLTDPAAPWVVVLVPDGDLTQRRELFGSSRDH